MPGFIWWVQTLHWYCLIISNMPSQFQRFRMHSLLPLPPATRHVNVNIRPNIYHYQTKSLHSIPICNRKIYSKPQQFSDCQHNTFKANPTKHNGILPQTQSLPPSSQSLLKPHQNINNSGLVCWRCDSGVMVGFVLAGGAPVGVLGCQCRLQLIFECTDHIDH